VHDADHADQVLESLERLRPLLVDPDAQLAVDDQLVEERLVRRVAQIRLLDGDQPDAGEKDLLALKVAGVLSA
jgi:hypothetical protein